MFLDVIHAKGKTLHSSRGFTDGTVSPTSQPRMH